jgi:undecaprenyl-diphosphatase
MPKPKKAAADLLLEADTKAEAKMKPIARSWPVRFLGQASELGDQPQVRTFATALIAAGLLASNRRLAKAGLRVLLSHEVATLAKDFVKGRVDRTRPRSASATQDRKLKKGSSLAKEETSFPSGHSAGATAAAVAFAGEYPEHRSLALSGAAAVAAAQVPRCAHYPTDVGAGVAIGAIAGVVSNWAFEAVSNKLGNTEQPDG